MKYSGPLGVRRPLGVGPLSSIDDKWVSQQLQRRAPQEMSREEFIRRCQESDSSEEWARNFAAAFIGEEAAQQIPEEQIRQSSKSFCEGLADFFGF